ncbi:hypothetical protein NMG60_11037153 [Bertholletia excelsa]
MEKNCGGFEETKPENVKQRGRRKSKQKEVAQKKKQPQRGMGVAQLERLRQQESLKKTTQSQTYPFQYFVPSSLIPNVTLSNFGGCGPMDQLGLNQRFLIQGLGYGELGGEVGGSGEVGTAVWERFQFGPSFRRRNVAETSTELSSVQKLKPNFDYCGLHYRMKCMNGEKLGYKQMGGPYDNVFHINGSSFLGLDLGRHQNIKVENWGFGGRAQSFAGYCPSGNVEQEVEVVAVHRKESSGGDETVLVEYEFFPGKGGRSSSSKELVFGSLKPEASVAAANGEVFETCCLTKNAANHIGFDAPASSIDLSLKLSC